MTCRSKGAFYRVIVAGMTWLMLPQVSQAEETLTWLVRELPPLTFASGPQKGQGALDQLMPVLMASLPQYRHITLQVNRARGLQILQSPLLACDPSILWSPTRAQSIAFSIPAFPIVSNGVAVMHQDRESFAPYVTDGSVDLAAWLTRDDARLGLIAERSYGPEIDQLLQQTPTEKLAPHYGNKALGSLLQMQSHGRLQAVLGYWPEIRYQALQQDLEPQDLDFYPVKGMSRYQQVYVGCSNTAEGHAIIHQINQTLRDTPLAQRAQAYAAWLDPALREKYLGDLESDQTSESP